MWKQFLSLGVFILLLVTIPVSAQPPAQSADPALAAVPTDAFFFVSAKVSKLWDHPAAKSLRDWEATQKSGPLGQLIGLRLGEIDRFTLFAATTDRDAGGELVAIVTTRKPYDESAVLKALCVEKPTIRPKGGGRIRAYPITEGFHWIVFADETTLVYLMRDADSKGLGPNLLAKLIARKTDGPLAAALAAAEKHDVTAALNIRDLRQDVGNPDGANLLFGRFAPLLKATSATLTADFDKSAKIRCTFHFPDAEGVKLGIKGLEEGITSFKALLNEDSGPRDDQIGRFVVAWLLKVLTSAKIDRNGTDLFATADVPFADDLSRFVAALPKDFVAFTNEMKAANNLKQIGIAIHNHNDAYGYCPGDVVKRDDKYLPWSWRVQILPFIEQNQLYTRLDLMKPWDDPANLKILQSVEMPKVFEIPGRPAPKGHTYFRIFSLPKSAKGTAQPWLTEGQLGPKLQEIPDGTSNTFMVVEAGEAVPWYQPDVLAYDGKLPLPQLGAKDANRFLACFGDGSVKALKPSKLGEKTIRALITINGGEVAELPK
jgi:hypothetical protein